MTVFQIKQGTVDQESTAETEYIARPFKNTAKKRKIIGD